MTTEQKLLGGQALELGSFRRVGAFRGREIGLGRLDDLSRVGQRGAEGGPDTVASIVVGREEIEHRPIETGGAGEGERDGGAVGGGQHEIDRVTGLSRLTVVHGESLGVSMRRVLEGGGQPSVVATPGGGRQGLDERCADAIVIDLEERLLVRGPDADESGPSQSVQAVRCARRELGCLACHRALEWAAGHGRDLQQASRPLVQAGGAGGQKGVEARLGTIPAIVLDELVEEEGASAGFSRDCGTPTGGVVVPEQAPRQLVGFGAGQLGHVDQLHPAVRGRQRGERQHPSDRRARLDLLASIAGHEQQRGLVGRAEQVREKRRAVDVAPLEVVDEQDERAALGETSKQFAKRRGGPPAQLVHIRLVGLPASAFVDRIHPGQHGKDTLQRPHVAGEQGCGLCS